MKKIKRKKALNRITSIRKYTNILKGSFTTAFFYFIVPAFVRCSIFVASQALYLHINVEL